MQGALCLKIMDNSVQMLEDQPKVQKVQIPPKFQSVMKQDTL